MAAPAACWARRPVSKRTVRLPYEPLSMTASAKVISGPSMRASFQVDGAAGVPVPLVFDRGPRHPAVRRGPGATVEDRGRWARNRRVWQ